jgi:hypothetical protein
MTRKQEERRAQGALSLSVSLSLGLFLCLSLSLVRRVNLSSCETPKRRADRGSTRARERLGQIRKMTQRSGPSHT